MPVQFDINGLDISFEEIDELEEYISEGDVDTDRVFQEEEGAGSDISHNFEKVIVVDNIPNGVPPEKQEKLIGVLTKVFVQCGKIQENGLHLALDENKATKGFAFVAFESKEGAEQAIKITDGFALTKSHVFKVFKYTDLDKYKNWPAQYVEKEPPAFTPGPNLKSWVMKPGQRDQYLLRHGNSTEIFWCEGMLLNAQGTLAYDGARERENGKIWCEMYTSWSPNGSYLATFHRQGIAIWGGDEFEKLGRFAHKDVQHILFSPNEKFLITWNGKDDNRDSRALIVWDIKTGKELRSFKVSKQPNGEPAEWPVMRFSPDDAFFARQTQDGISVFETRTMKLLEGKPVKTKGIQHFEWSPSDPIIAYWAPEVDNLPARVVLLDPVTRRERRSKNLFNVREVKLHWQDAGDFLCAQVLRHTKTGKTTFTNLEIFRMRDPNIPNEILELRDGVVEHFSWEPKRERFGILHGANVHRLKITFFTMGAIKGGDKLEKMYTIEGKEVTTLHWSPAGNSVIFAGKGINGNLEFWDIDENVSTADVEHFMCNEVQWDPSGRICATIATQPLFGATMKHKLENGFILWTFQGQQLRKENMEHFYQFAWRPRPKTVLDAKEVQKVMRGLKGYMSRYSKEDEIRRKRMETAANKEKIDALTEFRELVTIRIKKAEKQEKERLRLGLTEEENEEEYEVMDETEEIILSEKVEPF